MPDELLSTTAYRKNVAQNQKRGPSYGEYLSLVPLKNGMSLVPKNQNLDFICSLFLKIFFVPRVLHFRVLFPCSPEINVLVLLVPKTPGRASET